MKTGIVNRDLLGLACLLALATPAHAQAWPVATSLGSSMPEAASQRSVAGDAGVEAGGRMADEASQAVAMPEAAAADAPVIAGAIGDPPASADAMPSSEDDEQDGESAPDPFDIGGDDEAIGSSTRRFTFAHEVSRRVGSDGGIVNSRSSARAEYATFFRDSFYARLDAKLNAFWASDHRARGRSAQTEVVTSEAFFQYSRQGGSTSLKIGAQKLIWGESEGGAITDEVSPRNFSELFLIPLEESRLGQGMVVFDYFSRAGDWSVFYVPTPRFNEYPERGTEYHLDPFGDTAIVRDARGGPRDDEFGMRWRRTFGQSDISLMAARLTDNDHAYRVDGFAPTGEWLVSRLKQRLTMIGSTFSLTRGKTLVKGEVALKSSRAFNDAAFGIVERDVVDSAIGLSYSLGQNNMIGVEWVNSRILGWHPGIVGVPENAASLVANATFMFMHDKLSINWLTIYSEPYTSYQSSLRSAYKWDDNLSFGLDLHYVDAPDRRSGLRAYRDKDQVVLRVQYQF